MKPRRVKVLWDDAETDDGWQSTKSLSESPTRKVVSIGWVIIDKPTYIVLASDQGLNDDETNRRITIPKAWITKTTRL